MKNFELWERSAASRTGTSLCISAGSYYRHQNRVGSGSDKAAGTTAASISTASSAGIAPLVLTWRGAEPLDKLHMALRVRTYIVDYCWLFYILYFGLPVNFVFYVCMFLRTVGVLARILIWY